MNLEKLKQLIRPSSKSEPVIDGRRKAQDSKWARNVNTIGAQLSGYQHPQSRVNSFKKPGTSHPAAFLPSM